MIAAWRAAFAVGLSTIAVFAGATSASAASAPTGSIELNQSAGHLQITFSAKQDGRPFDLSGAQFAVTAAPPNATPRQLEVTQRGAEVAAAQPKYAMLMLDVSTSMNREERLPQAKIAAKAYLDKATAKGVHVGLVTFGKKIQTYQPTTPPQQLAETIDGLTTEGQTRLYDAVAATADLLRPLPGIRRILLLSDGEDRGSTTTRASAKRALEQKPNPINLTTVFLGDQSERPTIEELSGGKSNVIPTSQAAQLTPEFEKQVETFERVAVLDAAVPADLAGQDNVSLIVTATKSGLQISVERAVMLDKAAAPTQSSQALPKVVPPDPRLTAVTTPVVIAAIAALFIALTVLVATASGTLVRNPDEDSEVLRRLSIYSVGGRQPQQVVVREQRTRLGDNLLARTAVDLMGRVARSGNLEGVLDSRLESAGLPIRTVEWMLLHLGVAVGSALIFLLLSGGKIVAVLLGLILGLVGPWLFLLVRQSRRQTAFLRQLPDTLQLLAGSLQAGYSLPQAMDSVVRESTPPISTEFNRALIEARLGLPPEDALEGIALRTHSQDFGWVVMAIRIQRSVGGNLAELLSTVSDTLRERERLRRQVSALSAEGRLSGLILGLLPVVFTVYLLLTRPDYLQPLFTTSMGILLLIIGGSLLAIGAFWMSRVVRVEV